jgi:hypothetical protein
MAVRIADLYIDMNWDGAREWLERALSANNAAPDPYQTVALEEYRAKIALLENRLDDADRILTQSGGHQWLPPWLGWHAAHIAIHIRVLIASMAPQEEVARHVRKLSELFEATCSLGGQDYEVASLYFGLQYLGERSEADAYLVRYLDHGRREVTPLREELGAIADRVARVRKSAILKPTHQSTVSSQSTKRGGVVRSSRAKKLA